MKGLDAYRVIYRNWRGFNIEFYIFRRGSIQEVFLEQMVHIMNIAEIYGFLVKCEVEVYTDKDVYTGEEAFEIFEKYDRGELKDVNYFKICLRCENNEGGAIWVCYPP